jgi:hypothetical protein
MMVPPAALSPGLTEYEDRVERHERPHDSDIAVSVTGRVSECAGVEVQPELVARSVLRYHATSATE